MFLRMITIAGLSIVAESCTEAKLQSDGEYRAASGARQESAGAEPLDTPPAAVPLEPNVSSQSAVAPAGVQPPSSDALGSLPAAMQPIGVSGAYLVCFQTADVNCRLNDGSGQNFAVPTEYELRFFYQNKAVPYRAATVLPCQWKLGPDILATGSITVKLLLLSQNTVVKEFTTLFEGSALPIGDGTSNPQNGCPTDINPSAGPVVFASSTTF